MIAQLDKYFFKISKKKTMHRLIAYLHEGRPLTTKGQWFNKFLFMHFSQFRKRNEDIITPIFIVGTGRSGTTILGKILGIHDQILFLNEPKAIWSYAFENEDVIGTYRDKPGRLILNSDDYKEKTREIINSFYAHLLSLTNTNVIIDKYPELIFRIPWVKAICPSAKFIFVYRDPYETINSISKWSQRHGKISGDNMEDWWGLHNRKWDILVEETIIPNHNYTDIKNKLDKFKSDNLTKAAVEWIVTMDYGYKQLSNFNNIFLIDYEDLVFDSEKKLRALLNFIKVPKDNNVINYARSVLTKKKYRLETNMDETLNNHFRRIQEQFSRFLK